MNEKGLEYYMPRNLIASKGEGIINYSVWGWLVSFGTFPLLNLYKLKFVSRGNIVDSVLTNRGKPQTSGHYIFSV